MNNRPQKPTLREAAEAAVNVLENLGYDQVDLRNALAEPTVNESLIVQDHIPDATKMVALTAEQAQQIEEALVRLEQIDGMYSWADSLDVIRAARAQEQAEQEPVAWIKLNEDGVYIEDVTGFPVYANPVRTKDLTELLDVMVGMANYIDKLGGDSKGFRAVISKDRKLNGETK